METYNEVFGQDEIDAKYDRDREMEMDAESHHSENTEVKKYIPFAYELLAKLRLLTLAGYEEGELMWIGPSSSWKDVSIEEECILRDWELQINF